MLDFLFFDRTSYFVGYIGCNLPFWNFSWDISELGTYNKCYCFVIPVVILHCSYGWNKLMVSFVLWMLLLTNRQNWGNKYCHLVCSNWTNQTCFTAFHYFLISGDVTKFLLCSSSSETLNVLGTRFWTKPWILLLRLWTVMAASC